MSRSPPLDRCFFRQEVCSSPPAAVRPCRERVLGTCSSGGVRRLPRRRPQEQGGRPLGRTAGTGRPLPVPRQASRSPPPRRAPGEPRPPGSTAGDAGGNGDGTTVVYSSHVVSELEGVCDFLIVLGNARVQLADESSTCSPRTGRWLVRVPSGSRGPMWEPSSRPKRVDGRRTFWSGGCRWW